VTTTAPELARTFNEDVVERYARHFVELLIACLPEPQADIRMLDLACGTGFGTFPMSERLPEGSTVVALSDDRFELKELHRQLTPELRTRIFPHKEAAKRLPFADGVFDLVCACLPNRLWEPLRPVIREALRVVRPGGDFAVCVPLNGSFLELQAALGSSDQDDEQLAMQRMMAEITQLADAEEWVRLVERSGGVDTEVKRASVELEIVPPASKDRLIARHVLPLWLGEKRSEKTDQTLDGAVTEPLKTTIHIGCIVAKRGEGESA